MVSRWRILRTPINAKVENIDNIVKAIVTLHNYSQTKLSGNGNDIYCPPNFVDREGIKRFQCNYCQYSCYKAYRLRQHLKLHMSDSIPGQNRAKFSDEDRESSSVDEANQK
nr:unnamed protein product [Callosobruchus analis]